MELNKLTRLIVVFLLIFCGTSIADPSLTIYNQNFAVVREQFGLNLKKGMWDNEVSF